MQKYKVTFTEVGNTMLWAILVPAQNFDEALNTARRILVREVTAPDGYLLDGIERVDRYSDHIRYCSADN